MNIYKQLNLVFDYIEENLFDEIAVSKLSHFIGTSENNFKIFFSLLTGSSINEYIKNRRLSECIKLLASNKIIDVAVMCGYDSRASFSRAFKAFHGFNPSVYDKNKDFKYVSRLNFDENESQNSPYQASYTVLNEMTIYGTSKECQDYATIAAFWEDTFQKYPVLNCAEKYYGVVYKNKTNGNLKYYIGLESRFSKNNDVIHIPSGRYLSIFFNKDNIDKISKLGRSIKSKNIDVYPNIEIYKGKTVELLYKVFD